jgi:hypothetical protein
LSAAIAVAGGGSFLGWKVGGRANGGDWRVLYVDGEMHIADIRSAQRTENRPFTRMLPAWLTWNEDAKENKAIPDRATVVRRIFQMADSGLGQHAIAQRLNVEGVPTFGGLGNQRKADVWQRSYVKRVLTNSAVVGVFTPHQRRRDTQGKISRIPLDPIDNYFPAVIERELFERVASRAQATAARGRNAAAGPKSVFAGLLRCSHCGGIVTRMVKRANVYLICSRANRRRECKYQAVRYRDVEHALIENAKVIVEEAPRGLDTEELEAAIANLDIVVGIIGDEAQELTDELIREKSNALRARLREKEREYEEARESLRELRARRDALAKPYVARRLQALEAALAHQPLNVIEANKVLKEAASRIVINPEAGSMLIYWHHAPEQPTEAGPFHSKHNNTFDVVPGGYVHRKPKRAKGSTGGEGALNGVKNGF